MINPCRYPEDIKLIRDGVQEIAHLPYFTLEDLWEKYSATMAANWLMVDDGVIKDFREWLLNGSYMLF